MSRELERDYAGRFIRAALLTSLLLGIACSASKGGPSGDAGSEASSDGGLAAACVASGGTVTSDTCCMSTGDFPNTCLIGACGCAPSSSHAVQVCSCPSGCWNGSECTSMGMDASGPDSDASPNSIDAPSDNTTDSPTNETDAAGADSGQAAACTASGGTVSMESCCASASPFPNTCLIGACGCAPSSSQMLSVCNCGSGMCWNGLTCTP